MSIFISIISILLVGIDPITISYYLINKKNIYEFKRLATLTGLNFALPKRKHILEIYKPALVGEYKNRSVNMTTQKSHRTNKRMTELAVNCDTGSLIATIRPRTSEEGSYIYQAYARSQTRPILTGHAVFDRHFFVMTQNEESLHLFTESVCEFLIKRFVNISFWIEIRGYEIVVDDSDISSWNKTEGGIAENAVYMLNFMSELADLLERKQLK